MTLTDAARLSSESRSTNLPTTQEEICIERKPGEEEEEDDDGEMKFLIADFLEANSTNFGIRREREKIIYFPHTETKI